MLPEALRLYGARCELYAHGDSAPTGGGAVLLIPPSTAESTGATPRGELHGGYVMLCSPRLAPPPDGYAVIGSSRFEIGHSRHFSFAGVNLLRVSLTRVHTE